MNTPLGLGDALLATASDAIIATERGGVVTFWNRGAERIFGFSSAEAVARPLDLIIPDNFFGPVIGADTIAPWRRG